MNLKNLVSDIDSSDLTIGEDRPRRGRPRTNGADRDNRKQSLYFPADVIEEMQKEAKRLDRSLSWVVQRAWKVAREEVRALPTVNDIDAAAE